MQIRRDLNRKLNQRQIANYLKMKHKSRKRSNLKSKRSSASKRSSVLLSKPPKHKKRRKRPKPLNPMVSQTMRSKSKSRWKRTKSPSTN